MRLLDPAGAPQTKTQLEAGAQWKTAVAVAEVLIDPRRKEAGAKTITAIQAPAQTTQATWDALQAEPAPEAEPTPNCDYGGLKLLKLLNPFSVFTAVKCALQWAFVPPATATASVVTRVQTLWPMNVVLEVERTRRLVTDYFDEATSGDACWDVDFSDLPGPGNRTPGLHVWLPTPSTSGCPGTDGGPRTDNNNTAGDLFGWRAELRMLLVVGVWLGLAYRVVRAFTPHADQVAEVEPS